ncbi:mobile mystery protein B [Bernardetia litoralis DSM 6794]|uniref:Mobile mystery protein B n=1 Tax=Bernardetia litoralis (strain ATCC 23117 / DSM 6794 / NBRC 15988 / NCIMB 1366 / Fx l1 / Sio-4) TaxID=880071 RepID=I4AIP9_BERLS|nr:mobile mystery protein B [Bernardetia litoralis]AFM03834.1 mobile mystery protein B [Bernardetia litoralis DSM 6794]
MGLDLEYINGQTPLDEDEKDGLLIQTILTRQDLDEFEQQNVEDAMQWVFQRSFSIEQLFTEQFIKNLHKRMYGQVWSWAGSFRKTNKNIGVDKWQIPTQLKNLLDDVLFWIENKTYSENEIAIRFKHILVNIHCFPNGNGRHSRLVADMIISKIYKQKMYSWGEESIVKQGNTRVNYLKALKEADKGNYELLLEFARS